MVSESLKDIYIPSLDGLNEVNVWRWYLNVEKEIDLCAFTEDEVGYVKNYYRDAGLFTRWRRNYFRHYFSHSFSEIAQFLLKNRNHQHILELGCGVGVQTLFLALCGAKVTVVDTDGVALGILRKRKEFYEKLAGKTLDVTIIEKNSFDLDYAALSPIDAIYSMAAFNMMQPSSKLMEKITTRTTDDARFAVLDLSNKNWSRRIFSSRRRDGWSPQQFADKLINYGFHISMNRGVVSFPPLFWMFGYSFVQSFDSLLNKSWVMTLSHLVLAERSASRSAPPSQLNKADFGS